MANLGLLRFHLPRGFHEILRALGSYEVPCAGCAGVDKALLHAGIIAGVIHAFIFV